MRSPTAIGTVFCSSRGQIRWRAALGRCRVEEAEGAEPAITLERMEASWAPLGEQPVGGGTRSRGLGG